jgi:hydrogenase maturation protease
MTSTLFLGIGNTLLSDEGIGVHVIEFLARHFAGEAGATFLDGGTLSFTLAESIANHRNLIVIDAARLGAAPGTIRTLIEEEMDGYLTGNRQSVHEVSLLDLLDIARLSDCFPLRRALIGIQPQAIDWGEQPTPAVAAAIPLAAQAALRLHRDWGVG